MGDQHHIQEAYLKEFEDGTGKLRVYPKEGGKPFRRSAGQCAAEERFQSEVLEFLQNRMIETPGIRALRETGQLSDSQFQSISLWMALHILRNQKAFRELFESSGDWEERFKQELEVERLFAGYYRFAFICELDGDNDYWLTSDNPVIEFAIGEDMVRCCSISPKRMILFSPIDDVPAHELGIKNFFNAMVWANSDRYVFSHKNNVSMKRLQDDAKIFEMAPRLESIQSKSV
jgi:hypothetical protein